MESDMRVFGEDSQLKGTCEICSKSKNIVFSHNDQIICVCFLERIYLIYLNNISILMDPQNYTNPVILLEVRGFMHDTVQ